MNKEKKREYNKRYREKNREQISAKNAAYYVKNKERLLADHAVYATGHRKEKKETNAIYRANNKEKKKAYNAEHKEEIKKGDLRGLKSFEGVYYLIDEYLLTKYTTKLLSFFENTPQTTVDDLAKEIDISVELAKIVCEFLKEDGELLEKKLGQYTYIN